MTTSDTTPTSPLGVRDFRLLWLSSIPFFIFANATRFVYGWVVLDGLNRDEATQGAVVFILGLPGLFLLLPAGVWADRVDRRTMLLSTQLISVAVMLATALAITAGQLSLGLLIASAAATGAISAIGSPVRSSLVPELLPKELLLGGIAVNALAMTLSLVFGPVLAQLAGELAGFDGVFFFLTILLVAGFVVLVPMRTPATVQSSDRPTIGAALREGLGFVARDPALRVLFLMLALAGFVMNAIMFVTLQAHVKEGLGRTAGDVAPVLAVIGVGLALSSVFVMKRGDLPRKGTLFLRAMLVGTAMLTLMGRTTEYWQLFPLGLILGIAGGFFINMNQGLVQSVTPRDLMGRVMGLYTLIQGGLTPLGGLVLGFVAVEIGPDDTITIAAGLAFAAVAITYLLARPLHDLRT